MNTKLTINMRDGILDAEGSEEFVRTIYEDFKGEVAKWPSTAPAPPHQIVAPVPNSTNAHIREIAGSDTKKQPAKGPTSNNEVSKKATTKYRPSFDATLNLKSLPTFYDEMAPQNASEKILIFASFLHETLGFQSCTADHIYTCFFTVKDKTKIPEAFEQAFRDAQSRTHFIQLNSLQDISITIAGNNHLEEMKKRKNASST